MTAIGWLQILVFFAAIVAVTKPLGIYMFRVFEGDRQPLPRTFGRLERLCYRLSGVDPREGAHLEAVRLRAAGLQRRRLDRHLPDPAPAARAAVQPAALRRRRADVRVQHRRQLHDQHQLAGLLGRVDHELPVADGGPRLAQLHVGGGRHLRRARARRAASRAGRGRTARRRSVTSGST